MSNNDQQDTIGTAMRNLIESGFIVENTNISRQLDKAMETYFTKILEAKGYKVKADRPNQILHKINTNAAYDSVQYVNCGVSGNELSDLAVKARLHLQSKWGVSNYSVKTDPKNKELKITRYKPR